MLFFQAWVSQSYCFSSSGFLSWLSAPSTLQTTLPLPCWAQGTLWSPQYTRFPRRVSSLPLNSLQVYILHQLSLQTRKKSSLYSMPLSSRPCVWYGPKHIHFQNIRIGLKPTWNSSGWKYLVWRNVTWREMVCWLGEWARISCQHREEQNPVEQGASRKWWLFIVNILQRKGMLVWGVAWWSCLVCLRPEFNSQLSKKLANQLKVCFLRVPLVCEQCRVIKGSTCHLQ